MPTISYFRGIKIYILTGMIICPLTFMQVMQEKKSLFQ